jgi:hypothetical protein
MLTINGQAVVFVFWSKVGRGNKYSHLLIQMGKCVDIRHRIASPFFEVARISSLSLSVAGSQSTLCYGREKPDSTPANVELLASI